MKKFVGVLLGMVAMVLPAISFASLSVSQQLKVNIASQQIVKIMERDSIMMDEFLDILGQFEVKLQGDDVKLMVLSALREATLDAYYEVVNFSSCESYSDGCNTCVVGDDLMLACTKRACVWEGTPECLQYEGDDDDSGQDPVTMQAIECENAGGQFVSLYNECEGIDGLTCNSLGGTFDECASACRHEPEGSLCTMQCVQVCDFNGGGDEQELIDTQMDLDAAMSRWEAQELMSYELTQQYTCFCPREYVRPITYMVQDGVVDMDGARYADEDMETLDPEMSPVLHTIDDAFALIQDAIDRQADQIDVEYDEELGYPTSIVIDYSVMMADEEVYYTFDLQN